MKSLTRISVSLLAISFVMAACSRWSFDSNWESDGYHLIAIDAKSQMSLIFEDDNISLVGPTIFAVGANSNYVVVMQHPAIDQWAAKYDRSITNYFIVERRSNRFAERKAGVRGPLQKEEFESWSATLTLPKFTKVFDDLK